jgi:lipopolysaccharide/colanic/teichoic acid biosynthesis glycosyltransferase
MSLIGPRPERPELIEQLAEQLPFYRARLAVRPGLLGWAQLHRGGDTCLADVVDKLRYDLYYLNHLSLWLDARVVLGTLRMIVLHRKPTAGVEQAV